jgi:4'-phosphopantetheinyl transferase
LSSLELAEEEVQVYVASLAVSDDRYSELEGTLCAEERGRAKNLAPVLARRFVVARGLLRGLLAGFTGAAADSLRFRYGTSGKPSLAGHEIQFNISHSAEVGLFAFAPDRPVGIDVENLRPVRRLLDVAQRFLSEDDVRSLAAAPPQERDGTFLKAWVVREARLKAEGKGIWSGSELQESAESMTHKLFAPRPGYIAAVAAAGSDWRLYTCAMT